VTRSRGLFAGSKTGLADFDVSFAMDMANQKGYFQGEDFPRVQRWLERVNGMGTYKRALEKGVGYNLVSFT
jgi:glutathione S-transferase